jgi:UDP-glucose 4-epimerase
MKKILILGGVGFAGSGLATLLADRGDKVTVLDVIAKAHSPFIDRDDINYLWKATQDMTPEDVEGQDQIIDLAAQADVPMGFPSPRWTVEQNVLGTVCALEAARKAGCEKFVIAGSGNEFGRPLYLPIDEKHPLTPHNPYSFSKAAQEMAGWAWLTAYDVPVTIMSNGACLGKGMRRDIFVFKWLYNILQGKPVVLEGGDQTRDLTYVTDILDAWMLVIDADPSKVKGQKFQVSYGEEISVERILMMCLEACGQNYADWLDKGLVIKKPHRPGEDGQREQFTNAKARAVLGYDPKVTPKEGVDLTMAWIRDEVLKK